MTIKKQAFTAALLPPPPDPGEQVFRPYGGTGKTLSFVVPTGVYDVSVVLVGSSSGLGVQEPTHLKRGATVLLNTNTAIGSGVGGGNGGYGGAGKQGGGAGGYSGDGGAGSNSNAVAGSAGSGGGGGGGSIGNFSRAGRGGGVGLLGEGANGAGGPAYTDEPGNWGRTGSPPASGSPAGGGQTAGHAGGNLRWQNAIAVTPGETLTLQFDYSAASIDNEIIPAARIMWGAGRTYPNNAGDSFPQGQKTITASNTTFTVPAGITSVSACAQQLQGTSAAVTLVVAGTTVLRAENGNRLGDGGGDGGADIGGAAGGGGGYAGNGGDGGSAAPPGGGGGGGIAGYAVLNPPAAAFGGSAPGPTYSYVGAYPGGGVGISGQGASASGPTYAGSSDPVEGNTGGGDPGNPGGALAYKNSIAVTPGQVLTVNAAGGRIRIIWGPVRSYPTNAGSV